MPNLPEAAFLNHAGLNRQHVFNLAELPADLVAPLAPAAHERQLILFGHAGRRLWECVQAEGIRTEHPIDEYSVRTVEAWLAQALPAARARFVFPQSLGSRHIGLQRLGTIAGWHRASPFMVGIDSVWGSWFAYRVAILTDTDLPASQPVDNGYPCTSCATKPCITACPAGALAGGSFNLAACNAGRLAAESDCALGCTARSACPVGAEHRYEESQICHSAAGSLATIRRYQENLHKIA
ncbi:4Fe-4S dicluster domain-containing protein [Uliginosibacterium flavum]|uniref:4Fe-4S ferredoxin-type domain-containing protein n=1 Tax=Uliginosibacterium flavum TaxID=1396831 RepID=A0ABV2TKP5_9RHOO